MTTGMKIDLESINTDGKTVVLVVEDDEEITSILKQFLEREGCIVFTADDAIEAMLKLKIICKAECPKLILTDVNMPYDGIKFIEALQRTPELACIPVIPMTSAALAEIYNKRVLTKPLNLTELSARIKAEIKSTK